MDLTQVIVAVIGVFGLLLPAYWARKASQQTKPVNGQTVSQQVDQLHRLFVTHDDADKIHFGKLELKDGELANKITETHEYNKDRWHKDDGRYALTLAVLSTMADATLTEEEKARRYRALYDTAERSMKWDGKDRRKGEHDEAERPEALP